MRRTQSGFTLIELLIVISIIATLAAVLLPRLMETKAAADAASDALQMRTHSTWFLAYQRAHKQALPHKGGHKFVLSTWTSKIFDHNEENLDMYFSPGARDNDPDYRAAREQMELGQDPWPDINGVTTVDTHYAGRARKFIKSSTKSANEAWMATDNEGEWTFSDGTVNVFFTGGKVRSYSYQDLQARFGLGDFNLDEPIETWGPNSPIPECQKLDL
ncbi:MAG: prepilin-type N-terminal cleavage/methylation domain-containing protein [Planctomycetota bacterium]|jgi:prepilin-type N-terminal cleavage/methylation domain-containing protein